MELLEAVRTTAPGFSPSAIFLVHGEMLDGQSPKVQQCKVAWREKQKDPIFCLLIYYSAIHFGLPPFPYCFLIHTHHTVWCGKILTSPRKRGPDVEIGRPEITTLGSQHSKYLWGQVLRGPRALASSAWGKSEVEKWFSQERSQVAFWGLRLRGSLVDKLDNGIISALGW